MTTAVSPSVPIPLPWWRWINLLALDAVVVALVWLEVFGKMTGARLDRVEFVALGVAVWLIYGTDRLLDSRLPPDEQGRRERHRFAARQARRLVPLALVLLGLTVWLSMFHMNQTVLRGGIQLMVTVGVYFGILVASRCKATSFPALLVLAPVMTGILLGPLMTGMLHPGLELAAAWPQWWRLAGAATLLAVLFKGMRRQADAAPPWTLFRKLMGGFLFARGVALAPMLHFETGPESLWTAPVLLFGGACALNSLGIRLWENRDSGTAEDQILSRMYPFFSLLVSGGAVSEALGADLWARPVLFAVAAGSAALGLLHALRFRLRATVLAALADAVVMVSGLGALAVLWRM